jgi:sulfite exporter TauE/SafE/copper chaperone CopZ/plastocyanin domain-containing protein
METKILRVKGMTCVHCQDKIEKKLRGTAGIETASVDYNTGTASLSYNSETVTLQEIVSLIEQLDYTVVDDTGKDVGVKTTREVISGLVVILALFVMLQQFGIGTLSTAFPIAETGMGYGMLFIIGLITSLHCIAMCGGINVSQTIGRKKIVLPGLAYNLGRVISYTIVGAVVGALGQVLSLSGGMKGAVQIIAGVFMVIMAMNMLDIFPALRRLNVRLPKIFAKKIETERDAAGSPFIIGLLNGLMPCGPLQAMQLYALGTGSAVRGAIAMFLFSAGTVPLMFGLSALNSVLSKKFTARVMYIGAILVAVLGLMMFSNGWNLSALPDPIDSISALFNISGSDGAGSTFIPVIEDGVQIVNSTLSAGRYPAITVQQGLPVKWIIDAPEGSINGCNNRMFIREYAIEHRFKPGENLVEFLPQRTGRFTYSCWMGMIRSSITVLAEGEIANTDGAGSIKLIPAGVDIPTGAVSVAELDGENNFQTVTIKLRDDGFDPSIIIVQKNIPAAWVINNDSLDEGNSALIFPAYRTRMPVSEGENVIRFIPEDDFDFSTIDNVFYGYVKVVDDIYNFDSNIIKNEVAGWETQIYPDEYFNAKR